MAPRSSYTTRLAGRNPLREAEYRLWMMRRYVLWMLG